MSSVDTRIVVMSFDNKQFESGVATSLRTLDRLKNGLNFQNTTRILNGLSGTVKSFSFRGMEDGIRALNYRFSTLGIVGATVIQNLTTTAMQFGKRLWDSTLGQIKSGGLARAMNIEQAKFQLQGLKVEWDKISEDINYGVKDTAYGLDSAAKAASQLVASGVEFGDTFGPTGNSPMAKALRGISGVAAMTNSSYDDIAHIFTTIAGNGRMMGEQLQQFAGRGLNVAAVLGEQMHKSEQDIRDMVSKGKISFAEFSEAMNEAFGTQATRANETFSGAMSNVKAALSRIGASFATPGLTAARDILNSVRNVINDIHKDLAPVINDFEGLLNRVVPRITGAFDDLSNNKTWTLQVMLNNIYGTFKNVFGGISDIVRGVSIGFKSIFPEDFFNTVFTVIRKVNDFTDAFRLSAEQVAKLAEVFQGIFSIFDFFLYAIDQAGVAMDPLTVKLGEFMSKLLNISGSFGLWIKNQLDVIKGTNAIYDSVSWVSGYIISAIDAISSAIDKVREEGTERLFGIAKNIWESFKNTFGLATDIIHAFRISIKNFIPKDIIGTIVDISKKVKDFTSNFRLSSETIAKLSEVFNGVISIFSIYLDYVISFFKAMAPLFDYVEQYAGGILNVAASIGTWLKAQRDLLKENHTFYNFFKQYVELIISGVEEAKAGIKSFIETFKEFWAQNGRLEKIKHAWEGLKAIGDIFRQLFNYVSPIAKSIADIFMVVFEKAFGTFTIVGGDVIDTILSIISKLADWAIAIDNAITNNTVLTSVVEKVTSALGVAKGAIETFFDAFTGKKRDEADKSIERLSLIDKIAAIYGEIFGAVAEKIKSAFSKIWTTFKTVAGMVIDWFAPFGKQIGEAIKELSLEKLIDVIDSLLMTGILLKIQTFIKSLTSTTSGFGRIFTSITRAIGGFQGNFTKITNAISDGIDRLTGKSKDDEGKRARNLLMVAAAIGILALSIKGIASVDPESLAYSIAGIVVIFEMAIKAVNILQKVDASGDGLVKPVLAMIGLSVAISILSKAVKRLAKLTPENMMLSTIAIIALVATMIRAAQNIASGEGGAKSFIGAAISMAIFASALKGLSKAVKTLSKLDPEKMIISVIAIITLMNRLIANAERITEGQGGAKSFIGAAISMVIFGVALKQVAKAVKTLAKLEPERLMVSVLSIIGLMSAMSKVSENITSGEGGAKGFISTAISMVIFGEALKIVANVVKSLGELDTTVLIKGLGSIAALMYAIYLFADSLSKADTNVSIKDGFGTLLLAAALVVLSRVVKQLGSLGIKELALGLGSLAVMLYAMWQFADSMKNVKGLGKTAVSMLIMSAAILVLSKAIKSVSKLSFEEAIVGLIAIGGALLIIGEAVRMMPGAKDMLLSAIGISAMGVAMGILSASIVALSGLSWDQLAVGFTAIAASLIALIAAGMFIKTSGAGLGMLQLGATLTLIGAGAALAGLGLLAVSTALASLAVTGATAAFSLVTSFKIILQGLVDSSQLLSEAIVAMSLAFVSAAAQLIPVITDLVVQCLVAVLQTLEANIYQITALVALVIAHFLEALAQYLPTIIDAGITLMVFFINGMADGVREHSDEILLAVMNLMASILEFALSAIEILVRHIPLVGDKLVKGIESAKEGLRNALSYEEMYGIGKDSADAFSSGVEEASSGAENAGMTLGGGAKFGIEQVSGFGAEAGAKEGFDFASMLSGATGLSSAGGQALGSSALSGLTANQDLFSLAGTTDVTSYLNSFSNTDASGAGADLTNDLFSGLDMADLEGVSGEQVEEYLGPWRSGNEEASGAANTLNESLVTGLGADGKEFKTTGENSGKSYTEGVGGPRNKSRSTAAGRSLKNAAVNGADGGYDGMYNKGSDAGHGYYDGLGAWESLIQQRASNMTQQGMNAVAKAQESQSPSKKYFKLGSYAGEGYVNGIIPFIAKAGKAAMEMAKSGMDGAKTAMNHVSHLISGDLDIDPTIRPVVDLSEVQSGIDVMNQMFDTNDAVVNVRGIRSASAISGKLSPKLQNDGDSPVNGQNAQTFNFTQNNYSPKALSRLEIYRQTRNQFAQMKGAVSGT